MSARTPGARHRGLRVGFAAASLGGIFQRLAATALQQAHVRQLQFRPAATHL